MVLLDSHYDVAPGGDESGGENLMQSAGTASYMRFCTVTVANLMRNTGPAFSMSFSRP